MKEYDFNMANSMHNLGRSSRIDPTLKNQFLQVSFATSGGRMSLFQKLHTFTYLFFTIKYI